MKEHISAYEEVAQRVQKLTYCEVDNLLGRHKTSKRADKELLNRISNNCRLNRWILFEIEIKLKEKEYFKIKKRLKDCILLLNNLQHQPGAPKLREKSQSLLALFSSNILETTMSNFVKITKEIMDIEDETGRLYTLNKSKK